MKPVELELIMRDKTKEGMQSVETATRKVGKTVEQVTADFKARMQEQSNVVKQVEADIKSLEKQLEKTAPGKAKLEITADLSVAKQVLAEEKGELAALGQQLSESAQKHTTLRTQIANAKQEMAGMTEGTIEYQTAMQKLGQLQDQYGDITMQGRIHADDNKNIKATMDAVSGLSGAMTAGVGVASLFGAEEEKLAQIQTKLQAVMAITMGIQQVANTLNKDSYFTHVLLTKGKVMLTAATDRLSLSLGISTVAAKALMATLTMGLSVAIGALMLLWDKYTDKQQEAKKAQEAAADATKKQAEAEEELRKSAAGSVSAQLLTYKKLQIAYRELGDDMKKKEKFIKDNKKAFDELGIAVTGVKDAENLLINGEEAFLRTMNNRALIAASMEVAAEKYKDAIAKMMEVDAKKKKASDYSVTDLDADDKTLASTIAASNIRKSIGGQFLPGVADADVEQNIKAYAKMGNKYYSEILVAFNQEKEKALAEVARQNKDALARNAETEEKNAQQFIDQGAESFRQINKIKQENKDIFQQAGFVASTDSRTIGSTAETVKETNIADAELKARKKIEEMKLAIMEEGAAKEKIAARARFDAERQRIDQEESERINALVKAKKQGLTVSQEQVNRVADLAMQQKKLAMEQYTIDLCNIEKESFNKSQKQADAEKRSWIDYNKEYGSYMEKRKAITEEYVSKLTPDKTAGEKASYKKEMEKALNELDNRMFKDSIDFAKVFGNLDSLSSDALKKIRSELELYIRKAAKSLSPENLKELEDAFEKIDLKLIDRNPFDALNKGLKDNKMAVEAVGRAQDDLKLVQTGGEVITRVYTDANGKLVTQLLTVQQAEINLNTAQSKRQETLSKLSKAANAIGSQGREVVNAGHELIEMLDNFGVEVPEALTGTLNGLGQIMDGLANIDFTKPLSVLTSGISILAGVGNTIASIFGGGGDDGIAKYERATEVYGSYLNILDRVLEKQRELFKLNSQTGAQAYEQAIQTVRKQEEASRNLGKQYLNSGGSLKSHAKGVYQRKDMSWEARESAKKALGQSDYDKVMEARMNGLFDLSAKQLEDLQRDAPLFWAELHSDTQKYLQQIIDSNDELTKLENDRKEGLTKIDFDSFYNGFLDTLNDMDADSEDFANNLEEYLKNAILSSLLTEKYKDRIKGLYDNWASYTASGAELTATEIELLRKEQEAISSELLKKREELANTFSWQSESEKEQQRGKTGSFTTMSQDQGTKLEGLFTSVQGHVSNLDGTVTDIVKSTQLATAALAQIVLNTNYCRHLEQLAQDLSELKRDGFKMK